MPSKIHLLEHHPDPRRWFALAALSASVLLVSMDSTVLNVVMPTLSRDIGVSAGDQLWIVAAYALIAGSLLIAFGALGDRFGRRRILLSGFAVFAVSSLIAGYAQNGTVLIAARALLGVGGAMVMPSTLALLRTTFTDPAERGRAFAIWGAVAGSGIAVGPLTGGAVLHFLDSWRPVFFLNIPWVLILIVVVLLAIDESSSERDFPFDPWGTVIITSAVVLLASTAIRFGLGDPLTAGLCFALSIVLFAAFFKRQGRLEKPMVPLELFKDTSYVVVIIASCSMSFTLVGLQFVLAQYLELVVGVSPAMVGVRFLPAVVGALAGSLVSSVIMNRVGPRIPLLFGFGLTALMLIPIRFFAHIDENAFVLSFVLVGIAFGATIALVAGIDTVVGGISVRLAGIGAAIQETAMQIGAGLGTAILGVASASTFRDHLAARTEASHDYPAKIYESLAQALKFAENKLPAAEASRLSDLAKKSFIDGIYSSLTYAIIVVVVVVMLIAWKLENRPPGHEHGQIKQPDDQPTADSAETPRTSPDPVPALALDQAE